MDDRRFDDVVKVLGHGQASRRGTLLGLVGAVLGRLAARFAVSAGAKKRKKKLVRNEFGCVDVGGKCRGNDGNCCSGVCQGKKPKKGKKDKSVCVAHNVGGCTLDRDSCLTGDPAVSSCGQNAICTATTGKAAFCASTVDISNGRNCRICATDTDCEEQGFPPGSACVILTGGVCDGDTGCAGINGSSGTGCLAPGA
jgi:hypothetical protein